MLDQPVDRQSFVRQFLQDHTAQLQAVIRAYVLRGGLAYGEAAQAIAQDVFQDAVLEALSHADRLDPGTQAGAWFLSIAINIIRRRKAGLAKRYRREVPLSDLLTGPEDFRENSVFEQNGHTSSPGPEQVLEEREQVQEILALVSASDARVLRLAIVNGLNTEILARELGVRPVAARVRLHRALQRLRAAWQRREMSGEKGEYHA